MKASRSFRGANLNTNDFRRPALRRARRSRSQTGMATHLTLGTYAKIATLVVAAAWGFSQFYYKEIKVPTSAPVNVSLNLSLERLDLTHGEANNPLIPVALKAEAMNPSSRGHCLLPSVFIIRGATIKVPVPPVDLIKVSRVIKPYSGQFATRHSIRASSVIVAYGCLFTDDYLEPGERVQGHWVLHIPKGIYDFLQADAFIPYAESATAIAVDPVLDESGTFQYLTYRVGDDGTREKVSPEELQQDAGYGLSTACSMLSLW